MESMGLPTLAMYSVRSSRNLSAVAVLPVPTLPVRNAVQGLPLSARGLNSVSRLAICDSLWIRFTGM